MAAVAVPIALTAISIIRPALPSIISWVEGLFGHSSTTGKKTGMQKADAVMAIAQAALTGLANAGLVPSAGIVDPNFQKELGTVIQGIVNTMNSSGLLNGASSVPTISTVPGVAALTAGAAPGALSSFPYATAGSSGISLSAVGGVSITLPTGQVLTISPPPAAAGGKQ